MKYFLLCSFNHDGSSSACFHQPSGGLHLCGICVNQRPNPGGRKHGEIWDEMKPGDWVLRKQCTVFTTGGHSIQIIGCISITGTYIKRGEKTTEFWDKYCNIVMECIANGTITEYQNGYDCTETRLPVTPKSKSTTLPPATGSTKAQGTCGGKVHGETWDEMKKEGFGFRKQCNGSKVETIGCIAIITGTFVKKGENFTECCGSATILPRTSTKKPTEGTKRPTSTKAPTCSCGNDKAPGETWDEMQGDFGFRKQCTVNANVCSVETIGCVAITGTFVPKGGKNNITECCGSATILPRTSTQKPTGKPTDRPVTQKPIACPAGKKEGDEWNEKNEKGTREFRKKCVDGCKVIVGCISLRGTFIKRGENHTEYSDEQCDPVTACIAIGNDETGFREKALCNSATVIPRATSKLPITTPKPIAKFLLLEIIQINTASKLIRDSFPYYWKIEAELEDPSIIQNDEQNVTTHWLRMVKTECRRARDEHKIVKPDECSALKNGQGETTTAILTFRREVVGNTAKYTDITH